MEKRGLAEEEITGAIIRAFFEVYNTLGTGMPEYVYMRALQRETCASGHRVELEVPVAVHYKGEEVALLRLDMLVDGAVVVEAKSTDDLHPGAMRQLYNYLRATAYEVGLLLHFGQQPKFYRLECPNVRKRHRRD